MDDFNKVINYAKTFVDELIDRGKDNQALAEKVLNLNGQVSSLQEELAKLKEKEPRYEIKKMYPSITYGVFKNGYSHLIDVSYDTAINELNTLFINAARYSKEPAHFVTIKRYVDGECG